MKRKLQLTMLLCLAFLPAIASSEPTHLRVHRTDGTVVNAQLDEQLVLDFLTANLEEYLSLKHPELEQTQIALVEIQKLTFGDAIESEKPDNPDNPDNPDDPIYPDEGESDMINIFHADGSVFSASLDEAVVLKFLKENVQVSVLYQEPTLWLLDNIQKITFDLISVVDSLEEVEFDKIVSEESDVRKVIENGILYIIKGNVKYNVLGIRVQ